jgi:hypothetical protein
MSYSHWMQAYFLSNTKWKHFKLSPIHHMERIIEKIHMDLVRKRPLCDILRALESGLIGLEVLCDSSKSFFVFTAGAY